jgi:hypothetical protein
MVRSKIIRAVIAVAALVLLLACTKIEDDRPTMERVQMSTEYLDVLGKYNSVAREFSRAVKPMQEKEKRMDGTFDQEYWNKYDGQWKKTVEAMNDLKGYSYRFEPFKEMKPDFEKFFAKIGQYNDIVEKMRKDNAPWTPERKNRLYAALDPVYTDIFQQSKDITQKIDEIYNRVFVVGEKQK